MNSATPTRAHSRREDEGARSESIVLSPRALSNPSSQENSPKALKAGSRAKKGKQSSTNAGNGDLRRQLFAGPAAGCHRNCRLLLLIGVRSRAEKALACLTAICTIASAFAFREDKRLRMDPLLWPQLRGLPSFLSAVAAASVSLSAQTLS